ncbi:MAG: rhodanese-like domain-containing protein [Chloroflexota bacterium]|nr:rhodanese-like domain-containing protein [Chloroflexota bacterium]
MKRITLLVIGIILLILIPVLAGATPAAPTVSQFDVIATTADDYLNNPNTKWNISSKDLLAEMLTDGPFIISIRKPEDYAVGHIPGAVNLPASILFKSETLNTLPKDNKIVPYCYTGHTGSQVTAMLNMCGYDATNLQWGIMGWTKDTEVATKQFSNPTTNLPVETEANTSTATYDLPTVDVTASTNNLEIIRTACDDYATAGLKNIKAGDLNELITDGDTANDPVIVSVRMPEHYAKGHIPGAINIPLKDIAKIGNLQKLDPSKKIVVYCYTGRTASQATAILNTLGYDAVNLVWGISGWTTDPEVAPYRFNQDTSVDYPVEAGAGEAVPTPSGDGGGGCG